MSEVFNALFNTARKLCVIKQDPQWATWNGEVVPASSKKQSVTRFTSNFGKPFDMDPMIDKSIRMGEFPEFKDDREKIKTALKSRYEYSSDLGKRLHEALKWLIVDGFPKFARIQDTDKIGDYITSDAKFSWRETSTPEFNKAFCSILDWLTAPEFSHLIPFKAEFKVMDSEFNGRIDCACIDKTEFDKRMAESKLGKPFKLPVVLVDWKLKNQRFYQYTENEQISAYFDRNDTGAEHLLQLCTYAKVVRTAFPNWDVVGVICVIAQRPETPKALPENGYLTVKAPRSKNVKLSDIVSSGFDVMVDVLQRDINAKENFEFISGLMK